MATLLDIVKKGSTDRGVTIRCIQSSTGSAPGDPKTDVVYNSSGIDLWYRRQGAAKTSITEATLSALTDAHSDGGFLHIGDGEYRLDLPDAAFATGAQWVDVGGTVTNGIFVGGRVRLVDTDWEVANIPANVTQFGGSNGTFSGGRPEVNLTHINNDSGPVGVLELFAGVLDQSTGQIDSGTFAAAAIDAAALATDAAQEIRNAVTGGAYALDTDANGRIRIVDGTGTGELDTSSGLVSLTSAAISAIADQVWLETLADHSGSSGSTAEALNSAGSAGDPWTTTLPGSYTTGQAGNIIGALKFGLDATGQANVGTFFNNDAQASGVEIDQLARAAKLQRYVALLARSDSGTATALSTELGEINADFGGGAGDYSITADSLEANRDNIGTTGGAMTNLFAGVWNAATRTLTAGTNIQLPSNGLANVTAWTVAITGNLSGSVGSVTGGINTGSGTITTLDALDTAQDAKHDATKGDTAAILLDTGTDGVVVAAGSKTGYSLAATHDLYHADINFAVDEANTRDEYTVTWFKNGVRQTSVTGGQIQVVKRADGTDLIAAATNMTQIASTGSWKYDGETTERTTAGEAVIVIVTATIDAGTRTFSRVVSRDSEAAP